MSRQFEEYIEKQNKKREALLDLPDQFEESQIKIEELQEELRKNSSWKSKLKDYIVGGIIGAILGFGLSKLLG
jgi:TolA-binding protein